MQIIHFTAILLYSRWVPVISSRSMAKYSSSVFLHDMVCFVIGQNHSFGVDRLD